ncbi:MAG: hypothetical protein LBT18_02790 [Endomicrobium sp.]|jgi:hypothetical protein|nr:hypothetical protein [Endomicrobium sp.]
MSINRKKYILLCQYTNGRKKYDNKGAILDYIRENEMALFDDSTRQTFIRTQLNPVLKDIQDELQQTGTLRLFVIEFLKSSQLAAYRKEIEGYLLPVVEAGQVKISIIDLIAILGIRDIILVEILAKKFAKTGNLSEDEIGFLRKHNDFDLIKFTLLNADKTKRIDTITNLQTKLRVPFDDNVLTRALVEVIIPDKYMDDERQFLTGESDEKGFLTANLAILVELRKKFISVIEDNEESRSKLSNLEKLIVELTPFEGFNTYFPDEEEAEYFKIVKRSKDNSYLIALVKDGTKNIMYRLYAFMQLESNGYEYTEDDKSGITENLIVAFEEKIREQDFYMYSMPDSNVFNFKLRSLIRKGMDYQ